MAHIDDLKENPLKRKALLVSLSISQWPGTKKDQKAARDAETSNGAEEGTIKGIKYLIPRTAIKAVQQKATEIRSYHDKVTLPWRKGIDLLPTSLYLEYTQEIQRLTNQFQDAAEKYIFTQYAGYLAHAPQRLQSLYNPMDYPDLEDLKKRYSVRIEIEPIPDRPDPRLEVPDLDELTKAIEEATQNRFEEAQKELYNRLETALAHCADTLRDPEKNRFHETLITNIQDLVNIIPHHNITQDQRLNQIALEITQKITPYTAESLKGDSLYRRQVRSDADAILEAMKGLYA